MSSGGLGGVFLVFGAIILIILYVIAMLIITFWYIVIPAIALIIIYKKRKSVRKVYRGNRWVLKFRKREPKLSTHGVMSSSELNKGIEWVRHRNAEDERRRKEFSEKSLRHDHQSVRV